MDIILQVVQILIIAVGLHWTCERWAKFETRQYVVLVGMMTVIMFGTLAKERLHRQELQNYIFACVETCNERMMQEDVQAR